MFRRVEASRVSPLCLGESKRLACSPTCSQLLNADGGLRYPTPRKPVKTARIGLMYPTPRIGQMARIGLMYPSYRPNVSLVSA